MNTQRSPSSREPEKKSLRSKLFWTHSLVAAIGSISLLIVCAGVLWMRVTALRSTETTGPASHRATLTLEGVQQSTAALRGWVLLKEDHLREERRRAWRDKVEPNLDSLELALRKNHEADSLARLEKVRNKIPRLKNLQWWIEDIADAPGNSQVNAFVRTELLPQFEELDRLLESTFDVTKVVDQENSAKIQQTQLKLAQLKSSLMSYIATDSIKYRHAVDTQLQQLSNIFESIRIGDEDFSTLDLSQLLKSVSFVLAKVDLLIGDVLDLKEDSKGKIAEEMLSQRAVPLADEVAFELGQIAERQLECLQRDARQLEHASHLILLTSLLLGGVAIVFATTLARRSAEKLSTPVEELTKQTFALMNGDYGTAIEVTTDDEIGELTRCFNELRQELAYRDEQIRRSNSSILAMQKRCRSIIDAATVAILSVNENGEIILANDEVFRVFGYQPDELIGKPVETLVPTESRAGHKQYRDSFFAGEATRQMGADSVIKGQRKDGTLVPIEIGLSKIQEEDGALVLCTVVDVTERERARAIARQGEIHFQNLANASPAPMWGFRAGGNCTWISQSWVKYTGVKSVTNCLGVGWIDCIHPDDRQDALRECINALKKKAPFTFCYRLRRADGNFRWHKASANPRYDADGTFLGFVAMSIDEHDIRESQIVLERSNTELQQFAYVASHDLQEPLRKIASYCQLLLEEEGENLSDDGRDYLAVAINSASRLKTLVKDLLSLSRISTRGKTLRPTQPQTCVQTALENLEFVIAETHATVTFDELPVIHADETQLALLFQNLISNAIKYNQAEHPKVHVGVIEEETEWKFFVRDNGIGIEPKFFERIFEIFQRLHNRRDYSGTGIGLALCQRIIARFGGRIWVESEVGKGSCFYFALPKLDDESWTDERTREGEVAIASAH